MISIITDIYGNKYIDCKISYRLNLSPVSKEESLDEELVKQLVVESLQELADSGDCNEYIANISKKSISF